jgi:hypothetical protein
MDLATSGLLVAFDYPINSVGESITPEHELGSR